MVWFFIGTHAEYDALLRRLWGSHLSMWRTATEGKWRDKQSLSLSRDLFPTAADGIAAGPRLGENIGSVARSETNLIVPGISGTSWWNCTPIHSHGKKPALVMNWTFSRGSQ